MSKELIIRLYEISIKNISHTFDEEIKKLDELSHKIKRKSLKEQKGLANKLDAYDKVSEVNFPLTEKIRIVQESCEDQLTNILSELKKEN